jgi:copper chaperone NosL
MNGEENRIKSMRYLILVSVFLFACKAEPEPLYYGKDACHFCKMVLMDKSFGSELVTEKGKIYKFDDTNCMMNFLESDQIQGEVMAIKLVVDYSQPEKLIPVEHAFFLKSDEIRSPMNSELAAFGTAQAMREYKKKWKAIYLGWGEVQTQFK